MNLASITSIWPKQEFASTELVQLNGYLSQPVVKKYLLHMVSMTMQALAQGGLKPGQTAESYLIDEATIKGGLDVLDKLMKFEYPVQAGDSEESVVGPVES